MTVADLFSKRQKQARGEVPDVFVYDQLPKPLRVQIVHIIRDALGHDDGYEHPSAGICKFVHDTLAREYGVFELAGGRASTAAVEFFLLGESDHERVLDAVELIFRLVEGPCQNWQYVERAKPKLTAEQAIDELNARFREHGVGYQYGSGEMIRVDSQLIHADVVKPVLHLLRDPTFQGANTEYLRAYEHYRHERFEETLADCLKAFESLMKAICEKRNWNYNQTDTAKRLLEVCFSNGLVPTYLQSEFSALRATLEAGVPTVRNKQSGHGQGTQPRSVPRHLASYLLHLTATNILFLAEAESSLAG
jgi:hypothetical protein